MYYILPVAISPLLTLKREKKEERRKEEGRREKAESRIYSATSSSCFETEEMLVETGKSKALDAPVLIFLTNKVPSHSLEDLIMSPLSNKRTHPNVLQGVK